MKVRERTGWKRKEKESVQRNEEPLGRAWKGEEWTGGGKWKRTGDGSLETRKESSGRKRRKRGFREERKERGRGGNKEKRW